MGVASADFWGVAITATVTADGLLGSVGGLLPKLVAAARTGTPRVHTVLVAQGEAHEKEQIEKQLTSMNLVAAPNGWRDPAADFWVLRARMLAEAVAFLEDNKRHRSPRIDCTLPTPDHTPTVTGEELFAVSRFIEAGRRRPGYLILIGDDHVSTTAAFGRAVAQYQRCNGEAVFHMVPAEQRQVPSADRSADTVAACLYQRLRRKWGGVEPPAWLTLSPAECLQRFLSETRPREVLWIDGADRITQGGAALIPDVLPDPLPQGVVGVITTNREPESFCQKFEHVTVRRIGRRT